MPAQKSPERGAPLPIRLRLAFILLGIFILLWLPVEESSLALVVLLSCCACGLGLLVFAVQQPAASGASQRWRYLLAGLLAGAGVSVLALALVAVKTGVHGHGIPDYSPAQVSLLLRLAPLWMGLGLVAGAFLAWRRR